MNSPDPHFDVHAKAMALLSQFVQPGLLAHRLDLLLTLRPQPEDFGRVFTAEAVEGARDAYLSLWASPQPLNPPSHQTLVELHVATALELGSGSPTAREFPGGYAQIASLLQPDRLWVCWRFGTPGQSGGVLYDGLVWLDDRFAWFPKPWRFLANRPGSTSTSFASSTANAVVGQWDD